MSTIEEFPPTDVHFEDLSARGRSGWRSGVQWARIKATDEELNNLADNWYLARTTNVCGFFGPPGEFLRRLKNYDSFDPFDVYDPKQPEQRDVDHLWIAIGNETEPRETDQCSFEFWDGFAEGALTVFHERKRSRSKGDDMTITHVSDFLEKRKPEIFDETNYHPALIEYNKLAEDEPLPMDAVVVVGYDDLGETEYSWFLGNIRQESDGRYSGDMIWFLPYWDSMEWSKDRLFFEKKHVAKLLFANGGKFSWWDDQPWRREEYEVGGAT